MEPPAERSAAASPASSPPAGRAAPLERAAPPPPKRRRTTGSGSGKRKVKKPKGAKKGKHSLTARTVHTGHLPPTTTEQPEPKRRRTAAAAASAAIGDAAAADRQELPDGDDNGGVYKKARPIIGPKARRFAIAVAFVEIFGAPPKCEWNSLRDAEDDTGNNGWVKGTILLIKEYMQDKDPHAYRVIRAVLERVEHCAEQGEEYDGLTMGEAVKRTGKPKITPGTWEMELVANCTEEGLSLSHTTAAVNEYLVYEMGLPLVGRSAVYTAFKSMQPVESLVGTRSQEGGPEWANANWRWTTQKMIRLGVPVPADHQPWDSEQDTPDCFLGVL